jgi:hypothetical protein
MKLKNSVTSVLIARDAIPSVAKLISWQAKNIAHELHELNIRAGYRLLF